MSDEKVQAGALRRAMSRATGLYPVLMLAGLWQLAVTQGWMSPIFLPPLDEIFLRLWQLAVSGELFIALGVSLMRAVVGVGLAALLGIGVGFLMAQRRGIDWFVSPFVLIGFPAPKIALIPVFTLWLGIDSASKIALVLITCIFPFIIGAHIAANSVPRNLVWAARSLGTSDYALFRQVIFPATLPSLFNALRVAFPIGLITVFTVEMITGGGVGEKIIQAQNYFDTVTVFAYIFVTMAAGYITDGVIAQAQRKLAGWGES